MRVLELSPLQRVFMRVADFVFRRRRHRPVRYAGREFTPPQLLSEVLLPAEPGIYAIQLRNWSGSVEPVHFGACGNLHEELAIDGHDGFMHWLAQPGSRHGVWVSYSLASGLDHERRHHEGARLNRHYFPRRAHSVEEHLAVHRIHRSPVRRRGAADGIEREH